jgi:hypothetical protein
MSLEILKDGFLLLWQSEFERQLVESERNWRAQVICLQMSRVLNCLCHNRSHTHDTHRLRN